MEEKRKKVKVKEKWLINALNNHYDRADALVMTLESLSHLIRQENSRGIDIWAEARKIYNLDEKRVFVWRKKDTVIEETYKRKYTDIIGGRLLK